MEYSEMVEKYGDQAVKIRAALAKGETVEDRGLVAAGEVAEGDVVWTYTRGRIRRGIAVNVGRVNATVFYTTDGAITKAHQDHAYYQGIDLDRYYRDKYAEAMDTWNYRKEHASTFLDSHPDLEDYALQEATAKSAKMREQKAKPVEGHIIFTRFSAKLGKLYKEP